MPNPHCKLLASAPIFLSLLVTPSWVYSEPAESSETLAIDSSQETYGPTQAEIWQNAWDEMKLNFRNPKFQRPTLFRMGIGGAATWLGFHLESISFEDAWLPIFISALQVGAFNHLMPFFKRWYNSSHPFRLRPARPSETRAFVNFLVKATLVFCLYNYLGNSINHLVDSRPQEFALIAVTAVTMTLSQSPWAQSFLRDAELHSTATLAERGEALQRLNFRIVLLGSATIALNKLAVLQAEYAPLMQIALIVAGVAHYLFAPKLRRAFQVQSLAGAAIQSVGQPIWACLGALKALKK